MNLFSEVATVSAWSTPAAAARRVPVPVADGTFSERRRRFRREHRRRLAVALLVSVGFHAAALFAFNARSEKPAIVAPPGRDDEPIALDLPPPEPPPRTVARDDAEPEARPERMRAALPEPPTSVAADALAIEPVAFTPVPPQVAVPDWSIPLANERTPAPTLSREAVFKLGDLDRKPELVAQTAPTYPPQLATDTVSGVVVVRFIVNSQGAIAAPEVVSTPHPLLGDAVLRAVRQWKFRPGRKDGRAVSTEMELPVRFNPNA